MTLWNPLNVFSGRTASAADGPSASFDPSRTGDPLGLPPTDPAIGIGQTQIGGPANTGDPRRHPIGFAPPAEQDAEPRFRTELSFRRHHDLPRASATPTQPDDVQPSWQSPEQAGSIDVDQIDAVPELPEVVDELPEVEESVPFFKREISFRRKKTAAIEAVAADESGDEVVGDGEVTDEMALPADDWETPAVEVVAASVEPEEHDDAVESVEPVAFAVAEAVAFEDDVEDHSVAEPDAEPTVPFYKREISFGRKKTVAAEVVSAAASADEDAEITDEVASPADDWETPPAEFVAASVKPEEHDDAVESVEPEAFAVAEAVAFEDDIEDHSVAEPDAEPAVPFYKREMSFRRKKPAIDAAAAALVVDAANDDDTNDVSEGFAEVDDQAELVAQTDESAEILARVEAYSYDRAGIVAEIEPEVVPVVEASEESEPVAEAPAFAADLTEEEPFVVKPQVHEGGAAFELSAATEVDSAVPNDEALEDPPSADTDGFSVAEPAETAAVAAGFASSDAADTDYTWHTDDATHEPEAVEDSAAVEDVDDFAPLPVAVAAEAVPDEDALPELPDVAGEDAPSAGGRFGSRKRKSEKAPKRQGGKGRKVVGLKIGASQLAAAIVTETEQGHELLGLARRPLASGIVVDGEVRDETALAHALKEFFEDEKLPKSDVRVGLSSNRIGVRTLDIDGVEDDSHFDNAVRFKAHEVLPVALSESVLDYRVLDERINEDGGKTRRVLLVVAPRDQVEPYTRVANLAGIRLDAVDLEALGLLRAFVEPGTGTPTPDDTASVVVSIGHESSTLLVAGGGACEFTRVFDWGGGALEEAIAASLEVRPAEAATVLRHLSLSGPGRQYELLDEVTRAKATDAVRQRLTPFARELVNSLQFYQTQAESLGIGGIQITGGTSHLEGIEDALHQMIGVSVSVGDPLSRVIRGADFDPILEASIGSLAVPIGLAIDDASTRGVNLLPKGVVTRKSRRSTLIAIGAPVAVAVPLAALAFLYVGAHGKVVDQQSQLDAVKDELAALPQPTAPVIDAAVVGDEAVRATAVANVLGGRLAWESVFRDMSRVLPENVWLSSLSLTAPEATTLANGAVAAAAPAAPGPQAAPSAVSIDGYTFTQPDVARLLARLATLPSLKRVTLTSSTGQTMGNKKVVHFIIVADLNQTGGAS